MICKVLSLYQLHLFPPLSCCFSPGITLKIVAFLVHDAQLSFMLHVRVVEFIHEKENWQCFSRLRSRHFPPCFDHVLSESLEKNNITSSVKLPTDFCGLGRNEPKNFRDCKKNREIKASRIKIFAKLCTMVRNLNHKKLDIKT